MSKRIRLFGVEIDVLKMNEAVSLIHDWLRQPQDICRYVVTPNVDHTIVLQSNRSFKDVYQDAHLVLADGAPIILASRLLRKPLPERVAGSELVPNLFQAASPSQPIRTYLLGAGPGVAERAAKRITQQWPGVEVVGTYCPPMGFEKDPDEVQNILGKLRDTKPDLLVLGLSCPRQEIWIHQYHREVCAKVALCVGATIDFLAGEKPQAPVWMRRTGLEWVYRVATEPRRLAGRYAKDAWHFPQLVLREWWTRCQA